MSFGDRSRIDRDAMGPELLLARRGRGGTFELSTWPILSRTAFAASPRLI